MSDVDDADDVPVYDEDDPDGDRREYLDSPDHKNHQDLFPDDPEDEA